MTAIGWIQILLFCAIVAALVVPLDAYMTRVFNGERTFLSPILRPVESALYWIGGASTEELAHRREVEEIIDFLEIQSIRNEAAGALSYGLRKRVELARAIALKPDLILLDEPMAGMNLEEKEDMARFIVDLNEEWGMTVVMIEHDMGVVMDLSHRLMVLDFGRKIAEGLPEEIKANTDVRRAYLGEDYVVIGAQETKEAAQ